MSHTPQSLLSDIHQFCTYIIEFTHGMTYDEYQESALVRHAVERNLHTLGEATIRLRQLDADVASRLPDVDQIIGLRHRLVHGYLDDIDDEIIWRTISRSIPGLQSRVTHVLREMDQ